VYGYVDRASLEQRFEAREIAELLGEDYPPPDPVTRANSTAYALGVYYKPAISNGYYYKVTTAGTSAASPPTFSTTVGATFADGTATMTVQGLGPPDPEPERLVSAIDDAEGLVNGYLSVRYALPLSFVPFLVSNWVADIVRFKLWDNKASAEVRQRYEDVLRQLEQFAKGFIELPADEELEVGTAILVPVVYRTFTRVTLAGFVGANTGGIGRKSSALEF
jgi:phage gp36-like protein